MLDISDILDTPLEKYGETRSIQDKLDDNMLQYLQSTKDSKVYALPFYDGYKGITYNIELFEEYGFYFAEGGGFTTGKEGAKPKAKGPDNIAGTYDDGLPQTYEQFFEMMDYMVSRGVTPFVWSGRYRYADMLTRALWTTFEGKEQISLNYTFNGTAKSLVNVTNNGSISNFESAQLEKLPEMQINEDNAYYVFKQEGRFRALQFAKRLISGTDYYSSLSFSPSQSHTGAQEDFLYGGIVDTKPPVAMLIDGAWWEEKATGTFQSMVSDFENGERYSKKNRRFAFMPLPYFNMEQVLQKQEQGQKQTVMSLNYSFCFIKSNINPAKIDLAKKFLRFTSTDAMLQLFTETVSVSRPFNYEISAEKLSKMSTYAQSIYQIRRNSDVVYPFSGNAFWLSSGLDYDQMSFSNAVISGTSHSSPIYTFKDYPHITVKAYFDAIYEYQKNKWKDYPRPS